MADDAKGSVATAAEPQPLGFEERRAETPLFLPGH